MRVPPKLMISLASLALASAWADSVEAAPRWDGRLTVRVVDEESGAPLAARMELRDGRGRILRIAPQNVVVMPDGLYLDGQVELELRRGEYRFTVEAGPEFETRDGEFTIEPRSEDVAEVPLRRRVDMAHEGWWAGDLDVHVAGNDALLAARARGVAFAPATAWVQREAKCQTLFSDNMVDHHGTAPPWVGPQAALLAGDVGDLLLVGGASLRDGCPWPTGDAGATRLAEARATGTCVVARTATAWMLPVWIARGEIDAVSLFPAATAALEDPAQRPPNDPRLYPGREGPGRFCEAIYTHLLNCGLRIPPAAGSGADRQTSRRGASAIPLGASRVYVHLNESPTPKMWLAGLREGRVVATNGPLLRTRVEGRPPGHVFSLRAGEQREFQIALDLAFYSTTHVDYLEIVHNGAVMHHVRLDELAQQAGRLPPVIVDGSGWFQVRAVTTNNQYYQFAATGPYYVEAPGGPHISRTSVEFFLAWLQEAAEKFRADDSLLQEIEAARPFWQRLADSATTD